MRVLLALPYCNPNGTEGHVLILTRYLIEQGHSVTVAAPSGPMEQAFIQAGARFLSLPPILPSSFLRVAGILAKNASQQDLCHFHAAMELCVGLRLFEKKTPLVFTAHCYHTEWDYVKAGLFLNPTCQATVAVSTAERNRLLRWGLDESRNHLIFNGIESNRFGEKKGNLKKELGLKNELLIGTIGRLVPSKRIEDLIEAAAILRMSLPEVHFAVVGSGPQLPKLVRRIDRLGLRKNFHLLGQRDDVPDILASLDLFAMPTEREGLPLACLEAMASGLPVVCTDIPEFADFIEPGVNGLQVPVGHHGALAEALEKLIAAPILRRRLGENARETSNRFSAERMAERTLELYEKIISSGKKEKILLF
ncbi:MAG TPA: glycosyltransferase family 4 protein [Chroococcales cyanobacterium]|jgi:glycosyltransferase involved in cell wall biosynthesis